MAETFEPRRAKPGQVFTFSGPDGRQHNIRADDEGVVQPSNAQEQATLDGFGLPVARKAMAEQKAEEKPEPVKEAGPKTGGKG